MPESSSCRARKAERQFKLFHFITANQQGTLLRTLALQAHVGSELPSFPATAKKGDNYSELVLQLGIFQSGNTNYCLLHSLVEFLNHCWQRINNAARFLNSLWLLPEVLDEFSTTLFESSMIYFNIYLTSTFH